jgi:hypothetical protein
VSPCRSVLASVAGQKSRRPKFGGIAEVLGLPARQRHQPCLLASGVIVSSRPGRARSSSAANRAFGHDAFDAALDRSGDAARAPELPQTKGLPDRPEYPRPLDPDRRLGSRLGDRFYFADAAATLPSPISRSISPIMTTFMESVVR